MKAITQAQLFGLIHNLKGATFATIVTETEPKMRKTNNPYFGHIVKITTVNTTLNFSYANSVNAQRVKEGKEADFVPSPRKWGEKVEKTCLVMHNGMTYVEAKMNARPSDVHYIDSRTGARIDKTAIQEWLQEPNSNAEHQDLEKEIVLRDFKLSSFREIKLNQEHYVIPQK